jgi:hypothetical protein
MSNYDDVRQSLGSLKFDEEYREPRWVLWMDYAVAGFIAVGVLVLGIVFAPLWVPFALIGWALNRATKEDEE